MTVQARYWMLSINCYICWLNYLLICWRSDEWEWKFSMRYFYLWRWASIIYLQLKAYVFLIKKIACPPTSPTLQFDFNRTSQYYMYIIILTSQLINVYIGAILYHIVYVSFFFSRRNIKRSLLKVLTAWPFIVSQIPLSAAMCNMSI